MKYAIVLFIILFSVFATAQTPEGYIDSLAKNVLVDLQKSWSLGIDSNNEAIDIRVYNKFKSLFDSAARIVDDLNAYYQFDAGSHSGIYKTDVTPKDFDVYAHDVALQVKSINIDIDSVVETISNARAIIFTIRRKVEVQKTRQFVIPDIKDYVEKMIQNRHIEFDRSEDAIKMKNNFEKKLNDTRTAVYKFSSSRLLRIVIKYNDKDSSCKIMAIEGVTPDTAVICQNDDDRDGVLNEEDSLINIPGDFTANGRPDYDFDGVPDKIENDDKNNTNGEEIDKCRTTYGTLVNHGCPVSYFSTRMEISGFLGLQFNSPKINLPELNDLGYRDVSGKDAIDVLQSKKGVLQDPGIVTGIYAGGDFTYYLGKRKQTGISAGFTYAGFTALYKLTEPIIYTYKSFDGINDYRRQVTIDSLNEKIKYNVFNFPVLFNYRLYAGKGNKCVLSFKAGPSLMLFRNTSDYNATIDFGGLYQVDTISEDAITYYDHFDPGSTWNVYITSAGINTQNTAPGAANVFSQLYTNSNNYDFASHKNYRGQLNLTTATVAFNLAVDVKRQIGSGLFIKVGAHLVYAPLFEKNEKYIPINKTSDTYNSIYNSSARSSYSAFGMYVGLAYDF